MRKLWQTSKVKTWEGRIKSMRSHTEKEVGTLSAYICAHKEECGFHWLNHSWTRGFEFATRGFELVTSGF